MLFFCQKGTGGVQALGKGFLLARQGHPGLQRRHLQADATGQVLL